jgi:hypothetical protein
MQFFILLFLFIIEASKNHKFFQEHNNNCKKEYFLA